MIKPAILESAKKLLQRAALPLLAPTDSSLEAFLSVMAVDKKNIHGGIRLVLIRELGNAFISDDYDAELMYQVIVDNIA